MYVWIAVGLVIVLFFGILLTKIGNVLSNALYDRSGLETVAGRYFGGYTF